MIKLFLLLSGILLVIHIQAEKPVSFTSEYIDFIIDNKYFSVNGIYNFRNNTGKAINHDILFPFASDVSLIDSIEITDLKNRHSLPYKKLRKEVLFNLPIAAHDSTGIKVYYRQKKERRNIYILTSTQSWGEPLKKAFYSLTTDIDPGVNFFSIEPDYSITDSIHKIYFWEKSNFLPQTDLEIVINL